MLNVREEARLSSTARPVAVTQPRVSSNTQVKAVNWPWRYQVARYGSRDVRLDLLRGLCLFVMLIDHIGVFGPDSWLYVFTARGEFFISAAEGFVLISGLVMGLVYYKIIAKDGLAKTTSKIMNRVFKLYWLAVGLSLFFAALANYTSLSLWADRDWIQIKDPIEMVVGALTLHFAFHGSSIMVMYVIFLAFAPLVFYGIKQGKTWLVMGLSWLIWLGNWYYPNQFSTPFASNFPLASWQSLFVTGLVVGYHREKIANFSTEKLRAYYQIAIAGASVLLVSFYVASINGSLAQWFPGFNFEGFLHDLHDKGALPPARMFAVFVIFQGLYLLATWLWKPLDKALGWYLVPVGEVALYAFTMHLVIIVLFYNIPGVRELPYFFYGFALLAAAMVMWGMVKTKFLFNIIPR